MQASGGDTSAATAPPTATEESTNLGPISTPGEDSGAVMVSDEPSLVASQQQPSMSSSKQEGEQQEEKVEEQPQAEQEEKHEQSEEVEYYCRTYIPPDIMTKLESGAFQSLCKHLRDRSDEVQNIDLMTVSGFCRNCLAKWLVVEARKLSKSIKNDDVELSGEQEKIVQALDALGYEEAAEEVYGCQYAEWKKRHAKKASDLQMQLYNDSKPLHAKHDKSLLKAMGERPKEPIKQRSKSVGPETDAPAPSTSLLSDVCCQDVDSPTDKPAVTQTVTSAYIPPAPPEGNLKIKMGILTVSDRAAANLYKTGDLSGPTVEKAVLAKIDALNNAQRENNKDDVSSVSCSIIHRAVVPDEIPAIRNALRSWSGRNTDGSDDESVISDEICDLIFTTGGTGFSHRDVTPEATAGIVDRECRGLMSWASVECSAVQPLASLSRATAGVCGKTFIVNLPGNPVGVAQVVDLLLPLVSHAVKDLQEK